MERREFIKIACGLVGTWPLAAEAQQSGNQRLIGVLGADATAWGPWTVALNARLRELGWREGDNLAIEHRWAQGRSYPDQPLIPWLLRFRSQRPYANQATSDFYEFPPLHGSPPS